MTTPTPRWTAETEELAIDLVMQGYGRLIGRPGMTHEVRRLLTTLADAGVLIPVGGETRRYRGRGAGTSGLERTVTTYPDGTTVTGPWREVTDGGDPDVMAIQSWDAHERNAEVTDADTP